MILVVLVMLAHHNATSDLWQPKKDIIELLPECTPDSTDVGRLWNEGLASWGWLSTLPSSSSPRAREGLFCRFITMQAQCCACWARELGPGCRQSEAAQDAWVNDGVGRREVNDNGNDELLIVTLHSINRSQQAIQFSHDLLSSHT